MVQYWHSNYKYPLGAFMNWLRRFMMGRYGVDQLSLAFIIAFIILNILSLFIPSVFLYVLYLALFAVFMFRILSKNIAARQKENYRFLRMWNPIQAKFSGWKTKLKNRKQYRYLVCPQCKGKMKVPRGKGKIRVTCPNCSHKIVVKT